MAKRLVITSLAESELEKIHDYLLANWGHFVTEAFLLRFGEACTFISTYPSIYPFIHAGKRIRKCVLNKQNTIYFSEYPDRIEIITIFDTRQDAGKLISIIGD